MKGKISSKRALLITVLSVLIIFTALLLYFAFGGSTQDGLELSAEDVAVIPSEKQNSVNEKQVDSSKEPPEAGKKQVNTVQSSSSVGLPTRLEIPSINVDAPFEYVGLTSDGAMDVPESPGDAAWFNLGPSPGESGSAVVAGHYGWKNDIPAVFDDLYKLNKGDKILVEDENGNVVTFVVRKMKTYDKDEIVPEVFSSDDGKAHLNLVTCTGDWSTTEETFSGRLVVFTDKE